jgi:4-hydroxythreonine-4-phosphate dehydrogenase
MSFKFFFTTGNLKGVGLEVTLKTLMNRGEIKDKLIVLCDEKELIAHSEYLNFQTDSLNYINDLDEDVEAGLYFYTKGTPLDWFVSSVDYCLQHSSEAAIVTGPLSKDNFLDPKINGHTSYLENRFKDNDLFMTFIGSVYNCLLLTDHLPVSSISPQYIGKRLDKALQLLISLKEVLELKKPIGVLGLNPHAGENGLIGDEEIKFHKKIIPTFKNVHGPLSADGFFSKESYEKYSMIVANYHDQGLIPFKLLHGFGGCQTTLGLPFVRTSVNHGTASELYLKNVADPSSLLKAYETAKKLLVWRVKENGNQ